MKQRSNSAARAGRLVGCVAVTVALALGATACGGDSSGSGDSSSAPDAKKAATALDAGLKAHAAGDLTAASASTRRP